ncbi:hypothetical protein JMJ77_0003026 [Colletotrichum scovillei]|uniref:Uncharacterized protein n=1 Tax=Colletotrichum scovillei TaxID=1209932 RepID=A0A9P7QW86_9PEZI|nr:hypothetical protein JMJ78_0006241 [Colletotrichum scovillei]KAG7043320.1 hypothetical protein JMJ77_0003026 [Colletotrichum scovillei]KAG7062768.1 hypothetical protein JMJ76_0009611 [Colletotrichum scovillei]
MPSHQLRPALPGCAGPDSIPTEVFFAIIEAFLADAKASARAIEWRLEYEEDAPSNFRLALTGDLGYPGPLSIHRFRHISLPLQINKECRRLTSRVFMPIPSQHFYSQGTSPDIFVLPHLDLFRVPKVGKNSFGNLLDSVIYLPTFKAFTLMQQIRRFHILEFNMTILEVVENLPQLKEVIFNGESLIDTIEMSDTKCLLGMIPMDADNFPEWSDYHLPEKTKFGSFWNPFGCRSVRVYGKVSGSRLSTFEVYNTSDDPDAESPSIKFLKPEYTCSQCLSAINDGNKSETCPVGPASLPSGIFMAIVDILISEAVQSACPIFWTEVNLDISTISLYTRKHERVVYETRKRFASFRLPSQINRMSQEMVRQRFFEARIYTYMGIRDEEPVYGWALPDIDVFPIEDDYFRTSLEGIRLLRKMRNIMLPSSEKPTSSAFPAVPDNFSIILSLLPKLRKVVYLPEQVKFWCRRSRSALPSPRPSEPVEIGDRIDLNLHLLTSKVNDISNWENLEKKKVRLYVADGEGSAEIIQTTEGFRMKYLTPDETKDYKFLSGWMIL